MSRIVSDIVSYENQIHQFFLNQKIGSLLKRSNIDKQKGISPVSVFRFLVALVFTGKNLFRTLEAGRNCGMAKDTVYRFLNSVHTNCTRGLNSGKFNRFIPSAPTRLRNLTIAIEVESRI